MPAISQPIVYTISGIIYDEHNTPMPNVQVKVFEVDIRSQKELGSKTTDAKGFYSLGFNGVIAKPEYKAPDILLQVFHGNGVQLGQSPIYFNVQEQTTIDFKIGNSAIKTTNEFDALLQTIQPIIEPAQISLGSLLENDEHKDISFIAGETGEAKEKIAFIDTAFIFSKQTHIAPDIFYGLFRMGLPAELKELLMIKAASIKNALQQAMDENIISSKWAKGLDKIIITLNELSVKKIIDGDDEQSASFKKLFGAALSADQQKIFTATYFDNEEAPETFWDKLKTLPGFTESDIKKTKQLLSLNVLVGNQPHLAQHLFSKQSSDPELDEMSGYAKFTKVDWKQQITAAAVTAFPAWVKGSNDEEKKEHFAESLEQLHKQLYPTPFFAARLKQDGQSTFALKEQLNTFFKKNPGFELNTKNIRNQLEAANFENIADKEKVKAELKTINRLYKLTDDYKQVEALYGKQLFSSSDIVTRYGRQQFVKEFSTATGTAEAANMLYRKAVSVNNKATALITAYKMRNDIKVYAINGDAPDPEGYHEMFGDGELCECEHCQSVYSPAAYFTDVLNFIKNEDEEAYNELLRRRPDLDDILLTCKNTNTPLPYIDLVNELLEKEVLALQAASNAERIAIRNQSYQTEGTAAELLAMAEHINNNTYAQLQSATGDAVFSPVLPIDLPLDETRIYTEKLGLKRYDLMDGFYGSNEPGKLSDANLAAELFGFSNAELRIINGASSFTAVLPGTVKAILEKTKLSYIELLQLLETRFLNNSRAITIIQEGEGGEIPVPLTCALYKLFLEGASNEWLNKMVRFVRLWKKTGWDIFDLDRTLTAIGVDGFPDTEAAFNESILLPLANIERIRRFLNIPLRHVITFFSNVDSDIYLDHAKEGQPAIPSLYEQVFQNKTVIDDFATSPFNRDAALLSGPLAEQAETLCAALGITAAEFEILAPAAGLNIETISRLYRDVLLARSLKAPIADVKETIRITNNGPATGIWNPVQLLQFLEEWEIFKSSGIKANEFYNIIENNNGAGYLLYVDSDLIEMVQQNIDALTTISDEAISEEQRKIKYAERLQQFLDALSENVPLKDSMALVLSGQDDIALKNIIEGWLDDKNKEALGLLAGGALIDRLGQLKKSLSEYLFLKTTPQVFKQLRFLPDEVKWLQRNKAATGTEKLWQSPVDINDAGLYPAFRALLPIRQVAKIKTEEVSSWLQLFDIAIGNTAGAKAAWFNKFASLYAVAEAPLVFLCGSADEVNNKGRLNFSFPVDYTNAENVLALLNCSRVVEKLGGNAEQLKSLLSTTVAAEDAQGIKNLLKSKFGNPEWLDAVKPINDELRTKRRDALVAWLLADTNGGGWHSSNDLYEHLLIDVEMDDCMVTSRIKQGISSIQLFISHCLMNLENGIRLNEEFAGQWHTWRKQYRVWEANRKIFLYPENWIEPDLRDDKSPFFKELESQLKQNEITEDTAKEALIAYLQKLDTVANLEIVGLFHENEEQRNIVHVFGRTHNVPHQYFYRKQEDNVWTAWEKVELDIEGDHILPVVWNGRLMLFWLSITQKQTDSGTTSIDNPASGEVMSITSEPGTKVSSIKLVWCEYKNKKWQSKKTIKDSVDLLITGDPNLSSEIDNDELRIFINSSWDYNRSGMQKIRYFTFNNCSSVPKISGMLQSFWIEVPSGLTLTKMLLASGENNYKLKLFKDSFFKTDYEEKEELNILENIKSNTTLAFERTGNLLKKNELRFFYMDSQKSFCVYSREKPKYHNPGDLPTGSFDIVIKRTSKKLNSIKTEASGAISPFHSFVPESINADASPLLAETLFVLYDNYKGKKYVFVPFYHPYVCSYIKKLNVRGIDALYKVEVQAKEPKAIFNSTEYKPTSLVLNPYPKEEVDFSYKGSYSIYNWELFFHIPLLIADRLSKNQKFEEALHWFHYIFNPTKSPSGETGAERFWITKPFREEIEKGVLSLEDMLNKEGNADELEAQLSNWENNPFNPHAVARLRISAYMRNTVLRYIDNLIQWGDQLFRRDTIESINEATLLYILAFNILGKKPEVVPSRAKPIEKSFSLIKDELDRFSKTKAEIESFISPSSGDDNIWMPYFCLPKNDYLLKYWGTVADRLFKIRHCMNIEGVVRQLPLFEPPIDPALLVKATAAGLNLNEILNDLNAGLPHYRFQIMLQQANELCNDVKSLGSSLLSALEKKDGEELALLRSGHELKMLELIKDIKEKQRDEAKENLDGLIVSKSVVEEREAFYTKNVSAYLNQSEKTYFDSSESAIKIQRILEIRNYLVSVLHLMPDTKIGSGFTIGATFGGGNLGRGESAAINAMHSLSSLFRIEGELASMKGSFDRRMDEWKFQKKTAELELKQIEKQIIAAEIRLAIAEKEIENHRVQMEQSKEVDDYMRGKFPNTELYDWMLGQLSTVYFRSYQLAYSSAKKAEKCLQHELGIEQTSYVQYGYWDSLKKGLLSGDKLQYDLRRLENAYLEENKREFEITKHISLALIDPLQVQILKQTGECKINLPEELFDLDFPGHFFRRIKAVTISIPCVAGPYTSVNATLRLVSNECRISASLAEGGIYAKTADDITNTVVSRFRSNRAIITSIATSSGQHDSGMFELNFRDERYLPFEGCGAISSWVLELNKEFRQFDYKSISDIILHLHYTARESQLLKNKAIEHLQSYFSSAENNHVFTTAFSIRRGYPDAFHQLMHAEPPTATIEISKDRLSHLFNHALKPITKLVVYIVPKGELAVSPPDLFTINGKAFTSWLPITDTAIIGSEVPFDNFTSALPFVIEIKRSGGAFVNSNENIEDIIILFG